MKSIEILAPCGGFDAVAAAVRSGADAVYLGSKEFSARAGAENFDDEQLREAVAYCHVRDVKVYLTLNTIIFDSELEDVKRLIIAAARADVDALIVQNMGTAMLAKRIAPELPLHASTQMSVHSPSGAKLLWELGFKRVVLARELSRAEIKEIAESCPIELEVFVHGALCMCVSGQCYFSAVIGSRSGNRGRCAQTCRLPFSVGGKSGYALSLKDNSIIDHIRDLESIGVCSAKIEGRLKRPEYVAAATAACVESRDLGAISGETRKRLDGVFSRTGFTDGYYKSKRGYEMFGYRKKEDVVSATPRLLAEIRAAYKDEPKRVKLTASFSAEIGKAASFTVSDGAHTATAESEEICEPALNRALDREKCVAQLTKTGGTPYNIDSVDVTLDDKLSLPVSALNRLRRDALDLLSRRREIVHNYKINDIIIEKPKPHKAARKLRYGRFTSTKPGSGFKELDLCFVPFDSDPREIDRLIDEGFSVGIEIPRSLFSREEKVKERLKSLSELGITDVLCNNLAAVYIAKELGMRIHGGFGLNFTNTLDLLWVKEYGFEDTELSFELKLSQIRLLGADIPRGIITYGYLPVMLTRNCPNKSAGISCKTCGGRSKMTDRLGKTFIFYCDKNAVEILNTSPVVEPEGGSENASLDFEVFRFSVENSVENVEKISDFLRLCLNSKEKTHGLYQRGVF